jgi:hypothetical protein
MLVAQKFVESVYQLNITGNPGAAMANKMANNCVLAE